MTKAGRLDRIDLKILAALQADARMTNQALADAVGLSPSPCLQRVKRLEGRGILKGYLARVTLDGIAHSVTVIAAVSLESHARDQFDRFEAAAAAISELVEAYKVSGPFDYFLRFVCADVQTYERISDELLRDGPQGMKVSSHVVLQETKPFAGFPLEKLVEPEG
jgi:DNA-binding Lrp family transcriptional regulator